MPQKSDVQKLRERIEAEFTSMRLGLYGLAAGVAKHQFIEARMHQVGLYEDQLAEHLGKEQASALTCQVYMQQMEDLSDGRSLKKHAQENLPGHIPVEEERVTNEENEASIEHATATNHLSTGKRMDRKGGVLS